MKRFSTVVRAGALAAAVLLLTGSTVSAQSKTLVGNSVTATVTIVAIEQSSRTLTVKTEKGTYETIQAPPEVKRFSELKVGDKITARYYDNIVLRVKAPGEKSVDTGSQAVTGGAGAKPGGTASKQRTITATITEIDQSVPSITYSGPNNWKYSSRVQDKEALAKVKVGDKVDITWTEALLISFEPEKK